MKIIIKWLIILLKKLELLSALSCRLTYLTGKTIAPVHPKHLIDFGQFYYLDYMKQNDIVLDLGCNNGMHALKIAQRVKKVVAIDKDQQQLEVAGKMIRKKNLNNVKLLNYDLENLLPFADQTFDKVVFLAVLEHLKRRNQALKEVKRVMKPKGLLFLSVPNKETSWKKVKKKYGLSHYSDADHKIEYSFEELKALLDSHNFKVIKIEYAGSDTPMAGIIDMLGGISLSLYKKLTMRRVKQAYQNPKEAAAFKLVCKND